MNFTEIIKKKDENVPCSIRNGILPHQDESTGGKTKKGAPTLTETDTCNLPGKNSARRPRSHVAQYGCASRRIGASGYWFSLQPSLCFGVELENRKSISPYSGGAHALDRLDKRTTTLTKRRTHSTKPLMIPAVEHISTLTDCAC